MPRPITRIKWVQYRDDTWYLERCGDSMGENPAVSSSLGSGVRSHTLGGGCYELLSLWSQLLFSAS